MIFREATLADAEAVCAFARRLFEDTFGPDNHPDDLALYLQSAFSVATQTRELTDPSRTYLLGEINGVLACYALLRTDSTDPAVTAANPLEVERFYVDVPWRGAGLAQVMMQRIVAFARDARSDVLWLGVWERNPRAIRFYAKLGFEDVGSHPFLVGTDLQTDRIMTRRIAAPSSPTPQ